MVSNLAVAGISFRNEILSLLQESDIAALRPHLNHVTLTSNQVLHEANGLIADVYFVEEGVVSLAADMLDNGRVEVGLTGHEGLVGVSAILSSEPYSAYRTHPGCRCGISHECNRAALCHRTIRHSARPMPALYRVPLGSDRPGGRLQRPAQSAGTACALVADGP